MEIFEHLAQTEISFWHFPAGLVLFFILGVLGHIGRASFEPLPSRLSDSRRMDMFLSEGYSFWDYYYGTEYDVNGFYELDSFRNLRNAVGSSLIGFVLSWIMIPGFAETVAGSLNFFLSFTANLFIQSFEHYGLIG